MAQSLTHDASRHGRRRRRPRSPALDRHADHGSGPRREPGAGTVMARLLLCVRSVVGRQELHVRRDGRGCRRELPALPRADGRLTPHPALRRGVRHAVSRRPLGPVPCERASGPAGSRAHEIGAAEATLLPGTHRRRRGVFPRRQTPPGRRHGARAWSALLRGGPLRESASSDHPRGGPAGQGNEADLPGRPVGFCQRSGWSAVSVPGREPASRSSSPEPFPAIGRFSGRRTVARST